MNTKRETAYDRKAAGRRIRERRKSLGLSPAGLAEQMEKSEKYCLDIERGTCGMSVETLLSFSRHLGLDVNYIIYGDEEGISEENDIRRIVTALQRCDAPTRKKAERILWAFLRK